MARAMADKQQAGFAVNLGRHADHLPPLDGRRRRPISMMEIPAGIG
jgi:hypothetical protein